MSSPQFGYNYVEGNLCVLSAKMNLTGSGVYREVLAGNFWAAAEYTRIIFTPEGDIYLLVVENNRAIWKLLEGVSVPEGYFQLAVSVSQDQDLIVYFDNTVVFSGKGLAKV